VSWILNDYMEPSGPEITIIQGDLVDDHPVVDVNKLKIEELKRMVDCYANQAAHLELFMANETTIQADAELCERSWSRSATVKTKLQMNYLVVTGTYPFGGSVSYYRRIGPIAIGGGIAYSDKIPLLSAGILYGW